jgi:hypothetical protein
MKSDTCLRLWSLDGRSRKKEIGTFSLEFLETRQLLSAAVTDIPTLTSANLISTVTSSSANSSNSTATNGAQSGSNSATSNLSGTASGQTYNVNPLDDDGGSDQGSGGGSGSQPVSNKNDSPQTPGSPGDNGPAQSSDPVRLSDGTLLFNETDIESSGFGATWGITRSWTNNPMYQDNSKYNLGNGWVINSLPVLQISVYTPPPVQPILINSGGGGSDGSGGAVPLVRDESSSSQVESGDVEDTEYATILEGGGTSITFEGVGSGFSNLIFSNDTLQYENGSYVWTDGKGDVTTFNSDGQFSSYQPVGGSLITANYDDGNITSVTRSETQNGATTVES